jgi:ketosteroid isomerase-like protein
MFLPPRSGRGLDRIVADGAEAWSRGTRIFERRGGGWQMIHQHLSVPAPHP